MSIHKLATSGRRQLRTRRSLQILLLMGFWLAGELITHLANLPVPGGIVGMVLMLGLLLTKRLDAASVKLGASLFLAELLLFFIPAVLAVTDHREFLGVLGLKVLAVILTGTVAVMCATAVAAEVACRWYDSRLEKGHAGN